MESKSFDFTGLKIPRDYIDVKEDGYELTADFPKVGNDYYFREIGVIVTSEGKIYFTFMITAEVTRSSLLIAMRKQRKKGLGFS